MCDDISPDTSLRDEPVKRKKVGVSGLPELRSHNGVASKDSGSAIGVNRVARVQSSFIQIILANQFENPIMEIKSIAG